MSKFLPFAQALVVARSLGLASHKEWKSWCKEGRRPPNVPSAPDATYKDGGWQGWVHWLGSGGIKKASKFMPFTQAIDFAHSLGLVGRKAWKVWCKEGMRPPNVPSNPNRAYKDGGWQGWGHWLGTGNQASHTKEFLPFGGALRVARALRLVSKKEWHAWCRSGTRPANVPSAPDAVYRHGGWLGWGHWLGTGNQLMKNFMPFNEALAVARAADLASAAEWRTWCKEGRRPPNVPSSPHHTYKDGGWQGWGHWLGTGNQANDTKEFLPFDEALRVARSLRLVSKTEWEAWRRSGARPANVPANPGMVYVHDGWLGWGHWLGTGNQHTKSFLPFGESLVVARAADLASSTEWRAWCRDGMRPPNMPADPGRVYKLDGWRGWRHWLGTEPGAAAPLPALATGQQRASRKRKR